MMLQVYKPSQGGMTVAVEDTYEALARGRDSRAQRRAMLVWDGERAGA